MLNTKLNPIWPASIVVGVLFGMWLFYEHSRQNFEAYFADEQTRIFDEQCVVALEANLPEALARLEYVVNYYPSGTKQRTGSYLDRVVERTRRMAIARIIDHLRVLTGENLGDDAADWLLKLRSGESRISTSETSRELLILRPTFPRLPPARPLSETRSTSILISRETVCSCDCPSVLYEC